MCIIKSVILPAEDDQRKFVKHHGIVTSVAAFFRISFVPMNFTDATISTVFSRIIAGGDYSMEGDYSREEIISNIVHWKSCPKYFVLLSHEIKKRITSNKLNMGFLSITSFVS